MEIVYLDNHLLAVSKAAGVPSQPDSSGDRALDELARDFLRREFSKPGAVYLGLLHRLDRPTSGLVLLARTSKAAARMSEEFRRHRVRKTYFAAVACHAEPKSEARLEHALNRLANGNMAVTARDGKEARLSYRTLAKSADGRALLSIDLETGVKHQIRCQLAAIGLPVLGDFRYGPFGRPARPVRVEDGRAVLLHAARIGFTHPIKKEWLELRAPTPPYWRDFLDPTLLRALLATEKSDGSDPWHP